MGSSYFTSSPLPTSPPAKHEPPQRPAEREGLQHRDHVEAGGEGLLAGLVPEQRAAGVGAGGAAEERQLEQGGFRNPPRAGCGFGLVEPEGGKGLVLINSSNKFCLVRQNTATASACWTNAQFLVIAKIEE